MLRYFGDEHELLGGCGHCDICEALDLFGSYYPRRRPTEELLELVQLQDKADAYHVTLSGGQAQRLALALALAGNILILAATLDFSHSRDGLNALMAHAVVCTVVYALFPSAVYRFLAPILLATLCVVWIVCKDLAMLFHGLVGLEMLLVGYLFLQKRLPAALRPLARWLATRIFIVLEKPV